MYAQTRRNGIALVMFILGLMLLLTLALASTTWAAPNAQGGTVPTPPGPTAQPTSSNGGGDNGGGNNGGGQDNGGNTGGQDNGGGTSGGDTSGAPAVATVAPGSGSVCAIGDNGAQCTDDTLIVAVGAGAVPAGSALTIEGSFGQPPCPPSPDGNNFLNGCYRFGWIGTNAEPLAALSGPVQYCLAYGPTQVAAANNKPESLLVGFAGNDGKWTIVKPTLDTTGGRVCATTNQNIVWTGLFAPKAATAVLPTVGGPINQWWMLPLAVIGAILMFGAVRLARKGSA